MATGKKQHIYSMEMTFKEKPVILTLSIDDRDNSTAVMLTDREGKVIEEYYNKPKK